MRTCPSPWEGASGWSEPPADDARRARLLRVAGAAGSSAAAAGPSPWALTSDSVADSASALEVIGAGDQPRVTQGKIRVFAAGLPLDPCHGSAATDGPGLRVSLRRLLAVTHASGQVPGSHSFTKLKIASPRFPPPQAAASGRAQRQESPATASGQVSLTKDEQDAPDQPPPPPTKLRLALLCTALKS